MGRQYIDLTGKRFNCWEVIGLAKKKGKMFIGIVFVTVEL